MTTDAPPDAGELAELDLALRELAAAYLATGARAGVRALDANDQLQLRAIERDAVSSAADIRRVEFATGRRLLRELLGTDDAIPVGPRRIPALPSGWHGSLTHDRFAAMALVAPSSLGWWGIDVEPWQMLSEDEVRTLQRHDDADLDGCTLFVLKEAAYKAWSNAGGGLLGHHDVRIRCIDRSAVIAEVVAPAQLHVARTQISVRHRRTGRWLIALAGPLTCAPPSAT